MRTVVLFVAILFALNAARAQPPKGKSAAPPAPKVLVTAARSDTIAEPRRAPLVPGFATIKRAAIDAGALGCSLSGSGPSLFALCRDAVIAQRVAAAMSAAVRASIGGEPRTIISAIAPEGARVVSACAS